MDEIERVRHLIKTHIISTETENIYFTKSGYTGDNDESYYYVIKETQEGFEAGVMSKENIFSNYGLQLEDY